jgi:hypothetical protein
LSLGPEVWVTSDREVVFTEAECSSCGRKVELGFSLATLFAQGQNLGSVHPVELVEPPELSPAEVLAFAGSVPVFSPDDLKTLREDFHIGDEGVAT